MLIINITFFIMKNKLLYFFIVSLCFIGFSSCSDDDEDTSIHFYASSEKVNSVSVTTIGDVYVEVRNVNGTFTVKSNDETLATASINEHSVIHIKGVKEGKTSITVTDSENRSATLNVDVVMRTMSLYFQKQESLVEAQNPTTAEQAAIDKIKAEILTKLAPVGGGYKLTYTSESVGTLIYYPDTKKLTEKVEGTFKFESSDVPEKRALILYYNDKEYVYSFARGLSIRTSPAPQVYLIRDFTADYSQMTAPKITKAVGGLLVTSVNTF